MAEQLTESDTHFLELVEVPFMDPKTPGDFYWRCIPKKPVGDPFFTTEGSYYHRFNRDDAERRAFQHWKEVHEPGG